MKSITDICGVVPCDRKTYYRAFAKRRFVELYRQRSLDMVKQHVEAWLATVSGFVQGTMHVDGQPVKLYDYQVEFKES